MPDNPYVQGYIGVALYRWRCLVFTLNSGIDDRLRGRLLAHVNRYGSTYYVHSVMCPEVDTHDLFLAGRARSADYNIAAYMFRSEREADQQCRAWSSILKSRAVNPPVQGQCGAIFRVYRSSPKARVFRVEALAVTGWHYRHPDNLALLALRVEALQNLSKSIKLESNGCYVELYIGGSGIHLHDAPSSIAVDVGVGGYRDMYLRTSQELASAFMGFIPVADRALNHIQGDTNVCITRYF